MSSKLGETLPPNDEHAVSVSLPRWRDTLGWAKRDSRVMEKLQAGYPRFYVPQFVRMLEQVVMKLLDYSTCTGEEFGVKLFPASAMAQACRTYLLKKSEEADLICVSSVTSDGVRHWTDLRVYTVTYPNAMEKDALAFWQHTGYGISSRFAQFWLARAISRGQESIPHQEAKAAAASIRGRIANLYSQEIHHVAAEHVSLYQSGMSAISQIALAMSLQQSDRVFRVAVFGFLYVDTFKVLSCVHGFEHVLYGHAPPSDMDAFQRDLESGLQIDALFTEFPGNPLLRSLDLARVHALSQQYGFVVVVDDTVGTPVNLDLLGHCDAICTSLTKMFSGACNVMGGSVVLNRQSPHYDKLRDGISSNYVDAYFALDVIIMDQNSADFDRRVRVASRNAERIVDMLRSHQTTKEVFYPKGSSTQHFYDTFRRNNGGYGYLLSIKFIEPAAAIAFHDNLNVARGPSLGTNFTLACPYTLLAHYSELEWAAQYGVVEHLVRVSVGLEDEGWLVKVFEDALEAAEKFV